MTDLEQGQAVTPEEILEKREQRAIMLEQAARQYPGETLISYKLNIPGPVKRNPFIDRIFDWGSDAIRDRLPEAVILAQSRETTGPELILRTAREAGAVKQSMVGLEESTPLGRLLDIDVMEKGAALSRGDLGLSERRCFVCDRPARICSRSQAHSLSELFMAIETMVRQEPEAALRPDGLKVDLTPAE